MTQSNQIDGVRILAATAEGVIPVQGLDQHHQLDASWVWIDVEGTADREAVLGLGASLELDLLGLSDALDDELDLPKIDDFNDHLLVVLHGLRADRIATYEVTCFLTNRVLLTMHADNSPSVEAFWSQIQRNPDASKGGPDELLARLADVLTRRLTSVVDVFDGRVDELIEDALAAEPTLIADLTAIRSDLARVRRVAHPQREALDDLRRSPSAVITADGRRRFADVFDLASRTSQGFDGARTSLAEVLDAYRGAEARKATEVTKVLTVYAAIMLPLSLIAGIFGMNFVNMPGIDNERGWMYAVAAMLVVAIGSLMFFGSLGWIRVPSGRRARSLVGRGLVEAAKTPVKLVSTVIEVSRRPPARRTSSRRGRASGSE